LRRHALASDSRGGREGARTCHSALVVPDRRAQSSPGRPRRLLERDDLPPVHWLAHTPRGDAFLRSPLRLRRRVPVAVERRDRFVSSEAHDRLLRLARVDPLGNHRVTELGISPSSYLRLLRAQGAETRAAAAGLTTSDEVVSPA